MGTTRRWQAWVLAFARMTVEAGAIVDGASGGRCAVALQRGELRRRADVLPASRPGLQRDAARRHAVDQQPAERGAPALGQPRADARAHQREVGVGGAAALVVEVAAGVIGRVGHDPQVRVMAAVDEARHRLRREAELRRPDVARDHPEGLAAVLAEPVLHGGDAAARLQRAAEVAALVRPADRQPEAAAVAQHLGEALFQPGGVDHHLAHAAGGQRKQMPLDQRPAEDRQQRLRGGVGQRAHALAAARGEHDRARGQGGALGGVHEGAVYSACAACGLPRVCVARFVTFVARCGARSP